jgi:hypothetical protein
MRHLLALGALATMAAALVLVAAPGVGAQPNNAEQIIFSGTGGGNFASVGQGFGFWIWCQNENPAGQYEGVCQGAMYFYGLGITTHVFGQVTESNDLYTMSVTNGSNVTCTLANTSDVSGPRNTVNVSCTSPGGGGVSTNAVVNVTGP